MASNYEAPRGDYQQRASSESEGLPSRFAISVYDPTLVPWQNIAEDVYAMARANFATDPAHPMLGMRDDIQLFPNLAEAFQHEDTTICLLTDTGANKVAGFNLAVPMARMNPDREEEPERTAYGYYVVIDQAQRGRKLIGKLTDSLIAELATRGYAFLEGHARLREGFADKVSKSIPSESIVSEGPDEVTFPEVGPERFFRIDIKKYLGTASS